MGVIPKACILGRGGQDRRNFHKGDDTETH